MATRKNGPSKLVPDHKDARGTLSLVNQSTTSQPSPGADADRAWPPPGSRLSGRPHTSTVWPEWRALGGTFWRHPPLRPSGPASTTLGTSGTQRACSLLQVVFTATLQACHGDGGEGQGGWGYTAIVERGVVGPDPV